MTAVAGPAARVAVWWAGARPRTLGAGVVPVLVGSATVDRVVPWRVGAALLVAVGLQVGVNYANDHADGVRRVDRADRIGPTRLTAAGLASPRAVATAAGVAFAVAAAAGSALAVAVDLRLLVVGALAVLAAILYSSGPRPYAGLGLGEVAVFVFFGLVATCGSAYVHERSVPVAAWWAAVPVGLLAVAILVANNLRDRDTDAVAGKRTLAVRLGERRTRRIYAALVAAGFAVPVLGVVAGGLPVGALLVLAAVPLAVRPVRTVARAAGRELVPALTGTAVLHLGAGLALCTGLLVGRP